MLYLMNISLCKCVPGTCSGALTLLCPAPHLLEVPDLQHRHASSDVELVTTSDVAVRRAEEACHPAGVHLYGHADEGGHNGGAHGRILGQIREVEEDGDG